LSCQLIFYFFPGETILETIEFVEFLGGALSERRPDEEGIVTISVAIGAGLGVVHSVVENASAWQLNTKRLDRRHDRSAPSFSLCSRLPASLSSQTGSPVYGNRLLPRSGITLCLTLPLQSR
jgi:hypothetical protein